MKERTGTFEIRVKSGQTLSGFERSEMLELCTQAFGRDYGPVYATMKEPVHVFGRCGGKLVTHALWVTRWLQAGDSPPMRTAFIEAVATEQRYRHQGFASMIMERTIEEICDYDIAVLATGSRGFYERLGWQSWRGPLFIRIDNQLIPTPNEHGVMVLSLPQTPPIDLNAPLSAEWREGDLW